MIDIGGLTAFGATAPIRPRVDAAAPIVPVAEPSLDSRGLSGRTQSGRPQPAHPDTRQDNPPSSPRIERTTDPQLTGPTPAFQVNVLELDKDLQRVIAQLEAARGRTEANKAIAATPAPTEPSEPAQDTRPPDNAETKADNKESDTTRPF